MPLASVTIPGDSEEPCIQKFFQDAQSASKVVCSTSSVVRGKVFAHATMPSIHHFSYKGCQRCEQCDELFAAMPNLIGFSYSPADSTFPLSAQVLRSLDHSGLWEELEFLYVYQFPQCSPFQPSLPWPDLWHRRTLNFVEMNLVFQNPIDAKCILQASFPRLERLRISNSLGEEVLEWIMASELPSLRYLDVRFNGISSSALTQFAKLVSAHCSQLSEVSIDIYDDEKTEYYDWNGAVVSSFNGPIYGDDVTRMYLTGTSLRAVQSKTLYF